MTREQLERMRAKGFEYFGEAFRDTLAFAQIERALSDPSWAKWTDGDGDLHDTRTCGCGVCTNWRAYRNWFRREGWIVEEHQA